MADRCAISRWGSHGYGYDKHGARVVFNPQRGWVRIPATPEACRAWVHYRKAYLRLSQSARVRATSGGAS